MPGFQVPCVCSTPSDWQPCAQPRQVLLAHCSLQAYHKMGRMGAVWQSYGAKLKA